MGLLQNGLMGMGGLGGLGGITPPAGLLGPSYDPAQMKQLMLKRGLIGTGLGLMRTGKVGDAFAGGIEGADAARTGYMQDAMTMAQLDEKNRTRQAAAEQEQKVQAWLDTLPPEQQALANAFPDKAAEAFMKAQGGGGADEFGLVPQYGVDAQGNPVIMQLSKGGKAQQTALPEGISLSKTPIKLDAGTHWVILDPITRQPVGQIPKNLAEAEMQKEIGTMQGKQAASAPADIQAADNALNLVEQIKTSPNRERGTGLSSLGNVIPSTRGYDFQNMVDQAKSGAFLTAIQQMRGLGQLSNIEGQTATQAITRMNTATSEEAFMSALNDYEMIVRQARDRAAARLQGGAFAPPAAPAVPDVSTMSDEELEAIINGR